MMTKTSPWRVLLVDDERPARRWLAHCLSEHPEVTLCAEAASVKAARQAVLEHQPDLVFLDIQMPPHNGFDLLADLDPKVRVVFVTAYDRYAVRAFEANALDYLLKPVRPERLALTLGRLRSVNTPPNPLEELITIPLSGGVQRLPVRSIAAIHADAAYSHLELCRGGRLFTSRSISEWEKLLPTPPFERLDRSLLVNLLAVCGVQTLSRNEAHLTLAGVAKPLTLGRVASVRLRRALASE